MGLVVAYVTEYVIRCTNKLTVSYWFNRVHYSKFFINFYNNHTVVDNMKKIFLAVVLIAFATPSLASNLWKDCGIGHWIAGPTLKGFPALTTNIVWDLGTTATTSHVSTPEICAGPFWAAAKFINDTYPLIEQDTVQGSGEHMMAMLDIFECDNSVRPEIVNGIRQDFGKMIQDANYVGSTQTEKAQNYYNVVVKEVSQFANQCNVA